MYRLTSSGGVLRLSDNAYIPNDSDNRDWAAYQNWLLDGFTPEDALIPEAPIPTMVTMRQARLALLHAGLLDDVEAALLAMGDTVEGKAARIEWDYSSEVFRDKPFVQQLSAALGIAPDQLDALFVTAAAL